MSTIKHPVGPRSNRVYWRRRLMVLIVLAAIVAVVVLIVVRPGSGGDARAGASATSAPTASDTPTATPGAGTTDAAAGSTSTPAPHRTTIPTTKKLVAGAPCKAENVKVEAVTDQDSYASDSHPLLSLSLTNTGAVSCRIEAGTDAQVYTITSGSETYWKSTDCQTDKTKTQILLAPHKTVSSKPFAWDRTRSDPKTCADDARPEVPAGGASYHLSVSVDGIASATSKQFVLR